MPDLMVDTGLLIAAINPRDQGREQASRVLRSVVEGRWGRIHTTEAVLVEAFNYVSQRLPSITKAQELSTLIWGNRQRPGIVGRIHPISRGKLEEALALYHERFDQGLSLTDWTTVVCMEDQGIEELASFDTGFDGIVHRVPAPG